MKLGVWLRLGRVSNLPTIWSNVLAALALSGELGCSPVVLALAGIFSLYYVGGMYLNDAFDREIDARERPGRPIPSGQVSAGLVFGLGFGALALGTLGLGVVAHSADTSLLGALGSGGLLALFIVGYNAYHKQNPLSPVLMGLCRVMVYVACAYAVSDALAPSVGFGALGLLCHLIGLSYAAKQEAYNRLTRIWPLAFLLAPFAYGAYLAQGEPSVWPFLGAFALWMLHSVRFLRPGPGRSVPGAVVRLIAAIALLDAVFIASTGAVGWALVALFCAAATRLFQRVIPGT
jgi:hypothetical protein